MPAVRPPPAPAPAPESRRFELRIDRERPGRPWHATLVDPTSGACSEFTSPLALLRFIARDTVAARGGGLR